MENLEICFIVEKFHKWPDLISVFTSSSFARLTFSASSKASFSAWIWKYKHWWKEETMMKIYNISQKYDQSYLPIFWPNFFHHLFCVCRVITNQKIIENWTSFHLYKKHLFKLKSLSHYINLWFLIYCRSRVETFCTIGALPATLQFLYISEVSTHRDPDHLQTLQRERGKGKPTSSRARIRGKNRFETNKWSNYLIEEK